MYTAPGPLPVGMSLSRIVISFKITYLCSEYSGNVLRSGVKVHFNEIKISYLGLWEIQSEI